jgi:hypothetical protein
VYRVIDFRAISKTDKRNNTLTDANINPKYLCNHITVWTDVEGGIMMKLADSEIIEIPECSVECAVVTNNKRKRLI